MGYSIKILLDSVNDAGNRLTTFELTYPRFIHDQMLTHRSMSRNAASSRAIPVEKLIARVIDDPAMPLFWGANKPGMQATDEIENVSEAQAAWLAARTLAVTTARDLARLGLHKQIVNRVLQPYQHITAIFTATDFGNFFDLRCDDAAQPEIMYVACEMRAQLEMSTPKSLTTGQWHAPLMPHLMYTSDERDAMISAGRCARVSYLTHDNRVDTDADHALAERLIDQGHWSPFEHVARPTIGQCRNFFGWEQFRNVLESK